MKDCLYPYERPLLGIVGVIAHPFAERAFRPGLAGNGLAFDCDLAIGRNRKAGIGAAHDIDLVQKAWASKRDPLYLPGNFNNRILIDACIPYDMKLKGTFPQVVDVSADLRAKLRAKFPKLFN